MMKIYKVAGIGLVLSSVSAGASAFPARNAHAVVDAAHVLTAAENAELSIAVGTYTRSSHRQLVVATIPSLGGRSIAEYGYQLGRAWGIGSKQNDGTILLLAPAERKVRIEVGYGLEPVLTDAATSAIIHDRVVPLLKEGRTAAALEAGIEGIGERTGVSKDRVETTDGANYGNEMWIVGICSPHSSASTPSSCVA